MTSPAVVDLPYRYIDDGWKASPLSWSRKRQDGGRSSTPGGDTRTTRSSDPQYQSEDDQAAAEAISWDDQCLVCVGIDPSP